MFKNSGIKQLGFTLLEVQLYVAVIALVAVMVCQVALTYHALYDRISISAQHSVMLLAAIFQMNRAFDGTVAQVRARRDSDFQLGIRLKDSKLMGFKNTVFLDNVTSFHAELDRANDQLCGAAFMCEYRGKMATWYRAAFTKAYTCSSSL